MSSYLCLLFMSDSDRVTWQVSVIRCGVPFAYPNKFCLSKPYAHVAVSAKANGSMGSCCFQGKQKDANQLHMYIYIYVFTIWTRTGAFGGYPSLSCFERKPKGTRPFGDISFATDLYMHLNSLVLGQGETPMFEPEQFTICKYLWSLGQLVRLFEFGVSLSLLDLYVTSSLYQFHGHSKGSPSTVQSLGGRYPRIRLIVLQPKQGIHFEDKLPEVTCKQ